MDPGSWFHFQTRSPQAQSKLTLLFCEPPQASFPAAKAASIPQDFEAPFDAPPVEELFSRPIATEAKPAGATPLVLTALSPVPTTQRFPFNPEESLPVGPPASPAALDSH